MKKYAQPFLFCKGTQPTSWIRSDNNLLQCSGILNAKTTFGCQLQRGGQSDKVTLITPLKKTVPPGAGAGVDTSVIEAGEWISFQIGPITNPISESPVSGFKLVSLSDKRGFIAAGIGFLSVSEPAVVAADAKYVSLTASETLINKQTHF